MVYWVKHHPIITPLKDDDNMAWRCTVCDYIYEGDELPEDYVCPLCDVGPELFEEIKD